MNLNSSQKSASAHVAELAFQWDTPSPPTYRVRQSAERRTRVTVQWLTLLLAICVEAPPESLHARSSAKR